MVYIFTALYCEAHIFIKQFKLIKNQENTWFQEFYNDASTIRLIITGIGEIAASTTVGSVCALYKPTPNDLLLNVGICAHSTQKDGIFLCNKIIERATGKTFYPDILYRHAFCEGTIVTEMLPWSRDKMSASVLDKTLYDMEAAAIYQAGIHFFGPHQMLFLKIVSDNGSVEEVSKEQVEYLMGQYQDRIICYIEQILTVTQQNRADRENCLCQDEEQIFETLCTDLHCSKAMRDSMKQYIRYMTLTKLDYTSILQDMYEKNLLPCKDKREGKLRFEEFKRRLF